jgi:cytochrome oxidase assembly protein ShyY1
VYRFLLSRRWLGLAAAALVIATGCVLLGLWQLDRMQGRQERNDLIRASSESPPADAASLLAVDEALAPDAVWRRVRVQGRYDEANQLLVRNRPLEGANGYYVLTPLVSAEGPALLVNRGWVPAGEDARGPAAVPAAPDGEVTAVGRMRPSEAGDGGGSAPQGQVRRIDVAAIAAGLPYDVYGGYAELVSESPPPASAPTPMPEPEPEPGPHLAYAFQWFVFALIAVGGVTVLARREARETGNGPVVRESALVRG